MKTFLFSLLFFFSSLSYSHTVTEKRTSDCLNSPLISVVSQAEVYKNQGVSKQKLLANLNPSLDEDTQKDIRKVLDFVYDQKHEISASVHALTQCLNQ